MLSRHSTFAIAALAALTGCGGGGSSGGDAGTIIVAGPEVKPTPTPTPAPIPTPTPSPTPTVPAEQRVVLPDNKNYTIGNYNAYAAPWCALRNKSLVVGKDLSTTISLLPSQFPNDIEISAKTPDANPHDYGCGVYGYHHVHFGNYSGPLPKGKFEGMQIKSLKKLIVDFAYRDLGSTGEYNVLNEYFLTTEKDRQDLRVMEIGYFFHPSKSAISFAKTGGNLGRYDDPQGRAWSVYQAGQFVMLMPADGKDLVAGTVDMGHFLQHLVAKGKLTGNEWFNGAAMGIEPVRGNSSIKIEHWSVTMS